MRAYINIRMYNTCIPLPSFQKMGIKFGIYDDM